MEMHEQPWQDARAARANSDGRASREVRDSARSFHGDRAPGCFRWLVGFGDGSRVLSLVVPTSKKTRVRYTWLISNWAHF